MRMLDGLLVTLVGLLLQIGVATASTEVGFPQKPALSPDGSVLVFSWAGDLWAASSSGGPAVRLTSHPAEHSSPIFSPDGTQIAFESTREGSRNLFIMDLTGTPPGIVAGPVRRVTVSDRAQSLTGFSSDGEALIFSLRQPTLYRHEQMFRAPLDGGPVELITPAFGKHPTQAVNDDIVFCRGFGIPFRPAYRGSGAMSIWRMNAADGSFTQLTSFGGNDMEPFQLPDGSVVFISSRSGQNNVHRLAAGATDDQPGSVTQLTNFQPEGLASIGHGVRDLTVSADGSTAAFVVWEAIYTLDLRNAQAQPRAVALSASADGGLSENTRIDVSRQASEVALHPSGDAIAIVARGEIFVRSTKADRPTRRITHTHARERDIAWSPCGRLLYFSVDDEQSLGSLYAVRVALSEADLAIPLGTSEDPKPEADPEPEPEPADEAEGDGNGDDQDPEQADEKKEEPKADSKKDKPDHAKRWAEALIFTIEPVVVGSTWDTAPKPSPDGRSLLFVRGLGDLIQLDLETNLERVVFTGWDAPEVHWASDSTHIVYAVRDLDFNSDIWLLDIRPDDEGNTRKSINLTMHPDIETSPRLSHDGKVLTFISDRDNNNWQYDVYAIYLDRSLEGLRAFELVEHFEESVKAVKKLKPLDPDKKPENKPLSFDTDDAYLRVRRITNLPGSTTNLQITPGGDRIIFSAEVDGSRGLHSVDHLGRDRKLIIGSSVSNVSVSLTGDLVVYTDSGVAKTTPPGGGRTTTHSISAAVDINIAEQQRQKFMEGARTFGEIFYHPTMKGLDWAALTERYATLAERTRTSAEFNAVFSMLLGEVDGSHTGISGGESFSTRSASNGYLGIDIEPATNGWQVTRVVPLGPADRGDRGLLAGDIIVAIGDRPLVQNGKVLDFQSAMAGTSGEETLFEIRRNDPAARKYLLLTPQSFGAETNLRYQDDVLARRAEVERLSNGRLGYLHVRGMNAASVLDFERDLFAAANGREALIIDVRDNGGGSTADILLASLMAPAHAYTIPRGADPDSVRPYAYPRDRRLIYAWTKPINVLINQNSFSNAEIFAHAIKTTNRGTLVGTTTFGGVISTGSYSLIDGTTIRRPFRGWYTPDGRDMDVYGAVPDVAVEITPTDEASGRDPQLKAAVAELLGRLDRQ